MRHWILPVGEHESSLWIEDEGDTRQYTIAPNRELKRGDTVYFWWNPHNCFTGWGVVAETPMDFFEPENDILQKKKRPRLSVTVNRKKGFFPFITAAVMRQDRHLRDLIPPTVDDFYLTPLRPVQAAYLNDFIRELNLEAPLESVTTRWTIPDDAPLIIMQTLLTFGDKTQEGQLVEMVRDPWYEILKMIERDPNEIYNLDPRKFEELIAGAWLKRGYQVELTPPSGDKGRDVVLTVPGVGGVRIFDQVKRYKISRPVTYEEVSALVGTLVFEGNVSKGIVTTTSSFAPKIYTNPKVKQLMPWRLELRPRDSLLSWLNESLKL